MNFKKMHGLGNDFVIIDGRNETIGNPENLSKLVCDRHTGVGADGLIIAYGSDRADIRMDIYNSDGSRAEMCGNGLRCFAQYVYQERMVSSKAFTVDTLAGIMKPGLILDENGRVAGVVVDMGSPTFAPSDIPVVFNGEKFIDVPVEIENRVYKVSAIRMGVPHSIVYVDNMEEIDIKSIGSSIENHSLFPQKTNVNFVQVIDSQAIKVRTWERGAGSTLACGTGSCAAVVISALLGRTSRNVRVQLQLGELKIDWRQDGRVFMEGGAEDVFSGKLSKEIYPLQS